MLALPEDRDELSKRLNCKEEFHLAQNYTASLPGYMDAAVLVPFVLVDHAWHLLFTRRTNTVSDHKGQVAFPGGARDSDDYSPIDTALRETYEEIGIEREKILPISALPVMPTITHYYITPIIAFVDWPVKIKLAEEEVERVFTIPLEWLADPTHHAHRMYEGPGNIRREVIFYDQYDGEIVWGITAAITQCVIGKLK